MNRLHIRCGLVFLLASMGAQGASDALQPGHFRADASVVLIGATVVDNHDRLVRGLTREDFRLFEDKVEQTIRYFGEEDVPLSLAVVFDTSGSMAAKLASMRGALAAVLETSNPEDEFCLIAFAERPEVLVPWTADAAEVQNRVIAMPAHGRTALLDAIGAGLRQFGKSHNPRRAIVVFSDGGDNFSRLSERMLAHQLEEADVQIYAIDTSEFLSVPNHSFEEMVGPNLLAELCGHAAGQYFQLSDPRDPARVAERVSRELRSQYVLGYSPSSHAGDGKFHRLQLKMQPRSGRHLSVRWRHGYRAPTN
jgi:Ca-activated chloride channel family protein